MKSISTFLLVTLLSTAWAGNTVTHCVSTTNQLILALSQAGQSLNDDLIKIKNGTYPVPAGGFKYQSGNSGDLTLSGGWSGTVNVPCLVSNGFVTSTRLDGNHSERIFEVISDSNPLISITNLSFINGQAPAGEAAGGLLIPELPVFTGGIMLDRTRFENNRGQQGGAIRINQASYTEIANSLILDNITASGGGAIRLVLTDNSLTYVYNNNILHGSQSIQIRNAVTGLSLTSTAGAQALIANNVIYHNEIFGFGHSGSGDIYVYHNLLGQLPDPSLNNLNNLTFANPEFTDPENNFTPLITSPLINQGVMPGDHTIPLITNWPLGTQDHNHGLRIRDRRVEIGAIEALAETPVFKDGFDG